MSGDYLRLCPTCGAENAPEIMRCACGALLAGVDLTTRESLLPAGELAEKTPSTAAGSELHRCPHADCGQDNPPGSERCLYCDRPLTTPDAGLSRQPSLMALPTALRQRYRIERPLPSQGGEADLLLVSSLADSSSRVAKIYRHGIHPEREVMARLASVDPAHCIEILESGSSDGFTYELMEYCPLGSLRDLLRRGQPDAADLRTILAELADAIAAIHQLRLIHRDLKPENILLRSTTPLDLVLTDFGIASVCKATLRFTGQARTLAYAAPETLSGIIDDKTDWWSLGMIMLEAASGQHPFAGLSDAVILHRLSTRPVDVSAVNDPKLGKLLRGLLLRDPKPRWGAAEIRRWLADDPGLPEVFAEETRPPAGNPYQIGDALCFTREQLAVALAQHWPKALSDLDNGLLMNWLRQELKDQNLVRFLIELNHERKLHADLRLLHLIIELAPGIPPVWRGTSLGLREILKHADLALKNDASASLWLQELDEFAVLSTYAAAGNAEMADIDQRWHDALAQFNTTWTQLLEAIKVARHRQQNGITLFDDAMYGPGIPLRPSPQQLHARLLALSYDAAWVSRWRQHLAHETGLLALDCPWLETFGELAELPASRLLAIECLLPEARKQVKKQREREHNDAVEALARSRQLQQECQLALDELARFAGRWLIDAGQFQELQQRIEHFSQLSRQLRALGHGDADYQATRQAIARHAPTVNRIRDRIENLLARQTENRGWFSAPSLGFFMAALILLPLIVSERLFYPLLLGGTLLGVWRLLPNYFARRDIRELARRLERH